MPRKLAEIASRMVSNLNDSEEMARIVKELAGRKAAAGDMKAILQLHVEKFTLDHMVWAFVWFFNIDHYCYGQAPFAERITSILEIDEPSKG